LEDFITTKESFCEDTRGLTKSSDATSDYQKCIKEIKGDIKNLPVEKGADYCYLSYFWDDQYELLYSCLIAQGMHKDSTYCKLKYKNEVELKEKAVQLRKTEQGEAFVFNEDNDVVDVQTLYDCLKVEDNGGIPDSLEEAFDSTKCEKLVKMNTLDSYDKQRITDFTVTKSLEVETPVNVDGRTCHSSKNVDDKSVSFLTATFAAE